MRKRTFMAEALSLLAIGATTSIPALSAPGRPKVKITDIQVKRVRVVKELGSVVSGRAYRVGGDTLTLIHTDAGLTGYGPGITPAMLSIARERLMNADPLDIQRLARMLFNSGGAFSPVAGGANVEIALWDLVGKVLELPLYRLWGGHDGKLMPYASQWSTGTPEERARLAQTVRAHNWRAIKFRSHFPTVKEDVALVEQTRKLMGDDFIILCDANQAGDGPDGTNSGPTRWDYQRAVDTAREYARLGVYWLEEPLPRWDFAQLAQLRHAANLRLAGGEGSTGIHEYRDMLEQDSLDIIQFEVGLVGPTIARQITELAAAFDKRCVAHAGFGPGTFCAGHLNASLQNAVFFGPKSGVGPTWEVLYEPPALDIDQIWSVYENAPHIDKDGYMQLSDEPGLGVTIKQDLLQEV
ncbi:MAG TPA: mandelate racemase/muconate lactonizing enzyme family protein [Steroidobacteraceae bacterium]|jgi:L-alanine-DL-glutamate epimerase-like enolase superfamily enzyme